MSRLVSPMRRRSDARSASSLTRSTFFSRIPTTACQSASNVANMSIWSSGSGSVGPVVEGAQNLDDARLVLGELAQGLEVGDRFRVIVRVLDDDLVLIDGGRHVGELDLVESPEAEAETCRERRRGSLLGPPFVEL